MKRKNNGGCPHYWKIEPPYGETSKGVCQLCGEEALFLNSIPTPDYLLKKSKRGQLRRKSALLKHLNEQEKQEAISAVSEL